MKGAFSDSGSNLAEVDLCISSKMAKYPLGLFWVFSITLGDGRTGHLCGSQLGVSA